MAIRRATLGSICAHACVALAAPATLNGQAPASPPTDTPPKLTLEQMPPALRLGVRTELARRQIPVIRTLVIVPDARSYAAALDTWRLPARFPILIDDGTWLARENIARFSRAFFSPASGGGAGPADAPAPARVVRWAAPDTFTLPGEPAPRRAMLADVAAHAWSAPSAAALKDHWATLNFVPPGAVVASTLDPAWTAGLALAAFRGQPLIWLDRPAAFGDINSAAPLAAFDDFNAALTTALDETGHPWRGTGDGIDAVTLCLNMSGRITAPPEPGATGAPAKPDPRNLFKPVPGEPFATSDLLGRNTGGTRADRWAWCGQISGTEARAAYTAMCSLFLQGRAAWFFHGYEGGQPWNQYAPAEGAALLKKSDWSVRVNDLSRQGASDFRDLAAGGWAALGKAARTGKPAETHGNGVGGVGGVRAALIAVTTSGLSENFDLRPGGALSGDVPLLDTPALVYFVHSWSAQNPANRATIAGRWLERGATAYVGSVHEPYLAAFVPPAAFAARLLGPLPLGAAARIDEAPPWRVAVLGDPLLTFGPAAPEATVPLPLPGAASEADALAGSLKAQDFAAALWSLAHLARDRDASRLAGALVRELPIGALLDAGVAAAAAGPAFRTLDQPTLAAAISAGLARADAAPALRDMAWHGLASAAPGLSDGDLAALEAALREGSYKRDADELSRMIRKAKGDQPALDFLTRAATGAPNPAIRQQIDALISAAGGSEQPARR